ncbi:peptidase M75 family protein [Rothia sp. SD9660Na]|uniref:iron uptake system protein EfeO n=1 Tax=Rothia sp. SD9660Na TaxID=3047030 RepID=UPI0024B9E75F|nr:iron uptake system protein EfeO [Rothia sp. SD9660Na]WHS49793.1 peptidase M75 family protein [Rothia sp. SD9660Na]
MTTHRPILSTLITTSLALTLTACVDKQAQQADGNTITVSSTTSDCLVSTNSTTSGTVQFSITNNGEKTTEFYLLGSDGLRIVSEKENIAPGQTADLTVSLQPGEYYTACKPGMRGENVGTAAFTVTGDPVELTGEQKELYEQAVANYVNFAKNEVGELLPQVEKFATAYMNGDDEKARELYATTRTHYERIEPIAEALGILDPRIDYREIDYLAEAELLEQDDPTFTEWLGFHRIEKDLWVPAADALHPDGSSAHDGWSASSEEDRQRIGQTLINDVQALYDEIHSSTFAEDQQLNITSVSNGAAALLEEIAVGKVTGEENWWSHRDLWDFQANLEGSRIAFDLVAPIASAESEENAQLVETIDTAFNDLQAELDQYGSYEEGFTPYNEVSEEQRKELTTKLDAVREPLSQLTATLVD